MTEWCQKVEELIGVPMRSEQRTVIQELLNQKHVFAVLPTGYGKSVCFGAFPAAYKQVHPDSEAIALVITPLKSLTSSHIQTWQEKGVKSAVLKPRREMDDETLEGVKNGEFTLLFASPEVLQMDLWWGVLIGLRNKIKLLAVDEAHCMCKWGTTFRPDYMKIIEIRSLVTNAVTLALTATASIALVREVMTSLGLTNRMKIITLCPDRPEIYLRMEKVGTVIADSLCWYANLLEEQKRAAPKAIIYARTIDSVIKLYYYLNTRLGNNATEDGARDVDARFVEMFHGGSDTESQQRIVTNFRQTGSVLRCVVASVAFGMGVDIPNIRYVLHWGPASDPLAYWQEVGRCSRDGVLGEAITYITPRSRDKRVIHADMLAVIDSTLGQRECLRKKVLSYMKVEDAEGLCSLVARCCSICEVKALSQ